MNARFRREDGYALLITVFISLLFAVLALSLLSVTLSGVKRSQTSENIVQARELSAKGIDHLTNQIYRELNEALGEEGLPRSEFIERLNQTLNAYKCDGSGIRKANRTGEYAACITKIEDVTDANGEPNPLRKKVTFVSTGSSGGEEKRMTATYEIGTQAVPEPLHYALGANKECARKRNCIPGEGNMFLHGAVSITGDMKVDGNLIISNKARAVLGGGEYWINSLYPGARPADGKDRAQLVLGGEVYALNQIPGNYENYLNTVNFGFGFTKKTDRIEDVFFPGEAPRIVRLETSRQPIPITAQRNAFKYEKNSPGVTVIRKWLPLLPFVMPFENESYPDKKIYADCNWIITNTCIFNGNNTFGRFATNSDLEIKNSYKNFGKTIFLNGAYVGGNLTVGNGSTSSNPNNYDRVQIDGPIFVDGDVTIKGADAQFNSIMYVDGDVKIEYSRINGLNKNGREGSLIIFANGKIDIQNNSVYQDEPSRIKGFFYSEKELEMYGVGSNIRIEGGISARKIVLNAIRGRARDTKFENAQRYWNDYYEGVEGQRTRPSRLQIVYDPEIINTYSDIKSQEPVITDVDYPILLDRKPGE
ncbi:MAG: hypothetical protein C6W57_09755 [Caldibacillus debilis]|uniref:hypothetical protein n=1 Tax=Caldibacillus debilis TaxID=301148 RepID=UPI000B5579F7|nr:hypothetical protein [Caldibacillus debilis]OUM86697.1 MAG: hypothetical protein BAA03_03115 [Caldibacillus debilis]REJ16058.1 MAG: hypothetical protein C6W57_09755 [Caldibacillus debilis]